MSSILDALEKLETTGGPQPGGGGGGGPRRGPWIAVALAAAVVAVGVAFLLGRHSSPAPVAVAAVSTTLPPPTIPPPTVTPTTATSLAPTSSTIPAPPEEPAAAAPSAVAANRTAPPVPAPKSDDRERPWGEAKEPETPATPPSASPAVLAVARVTPPPAPRALPPPPPPAEPEPPRTSKLPAGAPRMRVSFLLYSSIPARRSVALTINDGGLTTLHEGDEAEGIGVVRISPDHVELRWQGETFRLDVRS